MGQVYLITINNNNKLTWSYARITTTTTTENSFINQEGHLRKIYTLEKICYNNNLKLLFEFGGVRMVNNKSNSEFNINNNNDFSTTIRDSSGTIAITIILNQ